MTSGDFQSFPISQIVINRDQRQRRELRDIDGLAQSIAAVGLIHPIVIRRDTAELVVGERRWTACQSLGWTHIPVQFLDELPPDQLQLIELEENVRRVDITWQEQCYAVERYHQLRAEADPSWSQQKTGTALGIKQSQVAEQIQVAVELRKGNERVATATKYSTARDVVRRDSERKAAAAERAILAEPTPAHPLLHADFLTWAPAYAGPKFNLLHCDFPYGQGYSHKTQKIARILGSYPDTGDVYWSLLECLLENVDRLLEPSAHLIFWFSMHTYTETKRVLEQMGWDLDPFPLIWKKNSGGIPDPNRKPFRKYETAFFGSRGDRKIVTAVDNIYDAPTTKDAHMSEKNLQMLKHFMRMVVDETTVMLDPTAGSGNAVKAAQALGAKTVLGLEQNEEFFQRAVEAW